MKKTLRERLEWLMRMSLLVFILGAAAFLSAITAMRFAIRSREVTMPNLIGKDVAEANRELATRGLQLRIADRIYSDIPLNAVVRQTPAPGTQMKESQQTHVVVSLGKRQLRIPALEGNTLRASRIELLRAGLQIGEVSNPYLPDVPAESVSRQNPRPGEGATSPHVDLLVSAGPRETAYVMPNLVGLSDVEAQRRLEASNLHQRVTYQPASQWPRGSVIAQNPPPGGRILATAIAELTVAN